ncbi:hypothetical protein WMF26_40810 [Sorangium sp. So ce185]|uniref:hypothetical protein n=1 Tax=Sorangium sp. So ce185 TaxID=3133287 RepID=UPI003F5E29A0
MGSPEYARNYLIKMMTLAQAPNVEIATPSGFDIHAWDGAETSSNARDGNVTLALSGSPVLLVER